MSVLPSVRPSFIHDAHRWCMFFLLVLHCDLCATQTEKLYLSSCPCVLSVSISVCASSQTKQVQWRNNAANPYPAFIIFVACFSKKLYTFFRSIFCIIIARYIINERGHVAQLKLATQNEKSSNHRTWRFCTVMSNLHSEKVGKVPHHQIEPIMGGIECVCSCVCVCVCDLTMIILLRYSFHGLDGHTLSLFIPLIGRHNVIVSS